jgi:GR25 family glycosyltransferase involved in LPS biosynthesis
MLVYLISSKEEKERIGNITYLERLCPNLVKIEAVYPGKVRIPFYNNIKLISKKRTGISLSDGAIGCLLSHRNTWRSFLHQKKAENCLILESDSKIENWEQVLKMSTPINQTFDMFFYGAFDGRVKLFNSTIKKSDNYIVGTPLINSLYCTYGYMINKKTARYLLKQTLIFNYPVDYWKLRIGNSGLNIGSVLPNLITTHNELLSNITIKKSNIYSKIFDLCVDLKNTIITKLN